MLWELKILFAKTKIFLNFEVIYNGFKKNALHTTVLDNWFVPILQVIATE